MMGSRAPGGSGGGGFGGETGYNNTQYGGVFIQEQKEHDERISNDIGGNGFRTNEELNFSAGLIGIVQVYWTFGVNGGQWAFQEMEKVFSFGEQVPYYRRYPNGAPEGVDMLDPLDHMALIEGLTLLKAGIAGLLKTIVGTTARTVAVNTATSALTKTGVQFTQHALDQMALRGVSKDMADVAIKNGQAFYDPLNHSINYVLPNGFASGKSLLVGVNVFTGDVTTVIRSSKDLINKRFLPLN